MEERIRLVELYSTGCYRVVEVAAALGVSPKTAYKWLARYVEGGEDALRERSRAPHRHPNATPAAVVAAVLGAKARHPRWGPAKLLPDPDEVPLVAQAWPAVSTRGAILARHGLVVARRQRRRTPPWSQPFQECRQPNDTWSADFKGWFRTQDGRRCDPLTVSDAYSRMLLGCQALPRPDHAHVRPVFERLLRHYGLPLAIRTDNGVPFASVGAGGLSPLSAWWVKLGILPERIRPAHPEENGRHERMHGTLKRETAQPPAASLRAQQRRFEAFRQEYNTVRPHQALGQVPPVRRYAPSPRPYPRTLQDPSYPETAAARRVRSSGAMKWRGEHVYVSEALAGELVAVTEAPDGWLVQFGPIVLGGLRPKMTRLDRLPPLTSLTAWHAWHHQRTVTDVPG